MGFLYDEEPTQWEKQNPLSPTLAPSTPVRYSSSLWGFSKEDDVPRQTTFQPYAALYDAATHGGVAAGIGLITSAFENARATHQHGAMGVFTRSGHLISLFGIGVFTYTFAKESAANIRESRDWKNSALGGVAVGLLMGVRRGTWPAILGGPAIAALGFSTFDILRQGGTGLISKERSYNELEIRELQDSMLMPRVNRFAEVKIPLPADGKPWYSN